MAVRVTNAEPAARNLSPAAILIESAMTMILPPPFVKLLALTPIDPIVVLTSVVKLANVGVEK